MFVKWVVLALMSCFLWTFIIWSICEICCERVCYIPRQLLWFLNHNFCIYHCVVMALLYYSSIEFIIHTVSEICWDKVCYILQHLLCIFRNIVVQNTASLSQCTMSFYEDILPVVLAVVTCFLLWVTNIYHIFIYLLHEVVTFQVIQRSFTFSIMTYRVTIGHMPWFHRWISSFL